MAEEAPATAAALEASSDAMEGTAVVLAVADEFAPPVAVVVVSNLTAARLAMANLAVRLDMLAVSAVEEALAAASAIEREVKLLAAFETD